MAYEKGPAVMEMKESDLFMLLSFFRVLSEECPFSLQFKNGIFLNIFDAKQKYERCI